MPSISDFKARSPFIQTVRLKMRAMRLSPRTEEAYIHYVCDFIAWSQWTRPEALSNQQVTDYLSFLATNRHVAAATQNVARAALEFMMEHCKTGCLKSHRIRNNLLTAKELESVLTWIPAKYRKLIEHNLNGHSIKTASKKGGFHSNSAIHALNKCAVQHIGRRVSLQGFKRSRLLHEIAGGLSWKQAEATYGAQAVKTACADFVRQFAPEIIVDNLSH